jgi:hypothetical protein
MYALNEPDISKEYKGREKSNNTRLAKCIFLTVYFLSFKVILSAQVGFPLQSSFKYLKGTDAAQPGNDRMIAGSDAGIKAEDDLPLTPEDIVIDISSPSGFYNSPFTVTITSSDTTAKIVYTFDCSNPQESLNRFVSSSPVSILVDPDDSTGRPHTPAFVIRASAVKTGFYPNRPVTRTYIFTENVLTQAYPGGDWPSGLVAGQVIDLEMDPRVVNNPEYSGEIAYSLKAIPSISIVTDNKNLFNPATGIYVNAWGHGAEWERECNVELIKPDGSKGFNIDAGLRIRGGWSRHGDYPKHSFRLFFRGEYDTTKLYYPLFDTEGTDSFDKVDLRTAQNYGWNNGSSLNTMVREVFSRDLQGEMGQPYTRSRYYHLYLNGMYWGIYQTQERSEARFASTYLGGKQEDYDVVKVNTEDWAYNIETTDGNLDSWFRLWNMCQAGFASDLNYFMLEGKDMYGRPVKGGEIMVDIDNLIDYMLIVFYTGNFDAPTSSFGNNKGCNNFFAIDNRTDKSTGYTFYASDNEHTLFTEAYGPGFGITEDRVNLATRNDEFKMEVYDFMHFHPQWLHYKLTQNENYRIRFADRAYRYFQPGGLLTPEKSLARLDKRINQIKDAIIAESARWGDGLRDGAMPYTKNDNWIPEINKIRDIYFPARNPIVIAQLRQAGLYPVLDAPVMMTSDSIITGQIVYLPSDLTIDINNPGNTGIIYYTFDGNDPRNYGGSIYGGSYQSVTDIRLDIKESTIIKARVLDHGYWSALREVSFINENEDFSHLKITELHYHPPDLVVGSDTTYGKDLEFIEFKNTGTNAISLAGLMLDSAVYYSFPLNELLSPGRFFVIASNSSAFFGYYGMLPSGEYKGNLSDAGEELLLKHTDGRIVTDFTYSDSYPWPSGPDGKGFSLSACERNPAGDPSSPLYWTQSVRKDGTPFADNFLSPPVDPGLDQGMLTAFPNPTDGMVSVKLERNPAITNMEVLLYDMTGHLILRTNTDNPGMIDLSSKNLATGMYIIRVLAYHIDTRTQIVFIK